MYAQQPFVPFPPPPRSRSREGGEEKEEDEEEEETFSICPNCRHVKTKRRRRRRRTKEEEDEEERHGPLQLCEKCEYIFLSKGFEENLDPDVPKSLLYSPRASSFSQQQRAQKIHANVCLFFSCGNCNSMLSLPELVARDCVVEESKLVVCGVCEELTIMSVVGGGGMRAGFGASRPPPMHQVPTHVHAMPPGGGMMMMMPIIGGGAYPNPYGGVPFGVPIPAPRQCYPPEQQQQQQQQYHSNNNHPSTPTIATMFPPLQKKNELGSNDGDTCEGENLKTINVHPVSGERSFRDATNQNAEYFHGHEEMFKDAAWKGKTECEACKSSEADAYHHTVAKSYPTLVRGGEKYGRDEFIYREVRCQQCGYSSIEKKRKY